MYIYLAALKNSSLLLNSRIFASTTGSSLPQSRPAPGPGRHGR